METIDSEIGGELKKGLWTVRLFTLSLALTIVLLLVTFSDIDLGFPHKLLMQTLLLLSIIAITMSLIGFIIAFFERKHNKKRALFGLIGNLVILLLYVFMFLWIMMVLTQ